MSEQYQGAWGQVVKWVGLFVMWLASWKLPDLRDLVGIVSGLILAGYGATQWWVLWRDKVRRRE